MIEPVHGDILKADAEALVNTVNCVGVMGRGIALQFRKAFPENYKVYRAVCDRNELRPGSMLVHDRRQLVNPRYIINFPTKRHWKTKSRIEGHFVAGYGDAEDRPDKEIEPMPEASKRAEEFLREHPETLRRFDHVVDLIEGFETPFGMELLSTVHWVAAREGAETVERAIAET
jgi:O-acetyl-ADP-ribose deacetylase (regulator of RNase III)